MTTTLAIRWRRTAARELVTLARNFHPRLWAASALVRFIPYATLSPLRVAIYRAAGMQLAANTTVGGPLTLIGPRPTRTIRVGSGCFISTCTMIADGRIDVGRNVTLGPGVMLITARHELGPPGRRCGVLAPRPVRVEDGAWIGAAALILPGVTVGRGAVVGAGAVVTADVAPNTVVAGNPARVLRELDDDADAPPARQGRETMAARR